MKITSEEVKKIIRKVRSYELEEDIENYPEDEREGRSDIQFLADEVSYIVSLYHEDGTCHSDDLADAKALLAETCYGKRIPIDIRTGRPLHGYWPHDIESAKSVVNEYRRLVRLKERLESKGIFGMW